MAPPAGLAGHRRSRGGRAGTWRLSPRRPVAVAGRGLHDQRGEPAGAADHRLTRAHRRRARSLLPVHARCRQPVRDIRGSHPAAVAAGDDRRGGLYRRAGQAARRHLRAAAPVSYRAAGRPALRAGAEDDVVCAGRSAVRLRRPVRGRRYLPAQPGGAGRPVAMVDGIRGRDRARRPGQHVRAAARGRARRDAGAGPRAGAAAALAGRGGGCRRCPRADDLPRLPARSRARLGYQARNP